MLVNSGSNGVGSIATDDGGHLTFDTGSTGAGQAERMRITSAGHVLVASTDAANASAGARLYSGGNAAFTKAATTLDLNRLTSDGIIIEFQKNTSNIGNIDTRGGDIVIRTGDTGIRFNDADNAIIPHHATDVINNQIDLGHASYGFKDLYLTGTIHHSSDLTILSLIHI